MPTKKRHNTNPGSELSSWNGDIASLAERVAALRDRFIEGGVSEEGLEELSPILSTWKERLIDRETRTLETGATFIHEVENVIDNVARGTVQLPEVSQWLVESLWEIIQLHRGAEEQQKAMRERREQLIRRLQKLIVRTANYLLTEDMLKVQTLSKWSIRLAFTDADTWESADPERILEELNQIGICDVVHKPETNGTEASKRSGQIQGYWLISLKTNVDRKIVEDLFLFVNDTSNIEIRLEEHIHRPSA